MKNNVPDWVRKLKSSIPFWCVSPINWEKCCTNCCIYQACQVIWWRLTMFSGYPLTLSEASQLYRYTKSFGNRILTQQPIHIHSIYVFSHRFYAKPTERLFFLRPSVFLDDIENAKKDLFSSAIWLDKGSAMVTSDWL